MKYIKLFESTTIKHTDPIAVNHILRNFTRKLEDVIIELQNLDKKENKAFHTSTIRRYFISNGNIHILYKKDFIKILKISLKEESNIVTILVRLFSNFFKYNKNANEFVELIRNSLSEYITVDVGEETEFKFPINEMNNVLEKIEEYYIFLDSKRYNL